MTITKKEINELRDEVTRASTKLYEARQAYADQECPFSVGDIVESAAWSYKGKKMKITKIRPSVHSSGGDWTVVGKVIRTNGTIGVNICEFSQKDYEAAKCTTQN